MKTQTNIEGGFIGKTEGQMENMWKRNGLSLSVPPASVQISLILRTVFKMIGPIHQNYWINLEKWKYLLDLGLILLTKISDPIIQLYGK